MKVLIISHNAVSTHQSMGKTFCTLFSKFKKSELCQLYIYPTIPNIDFCDSYYRITDKDVLKGLFSRNVNGRMIGKEEISADSSLFENKKNESFYRNRKNYTSIRKLARDFMWSMSPWFNTNLKKWLDKQKITHIFIAPGGYKFIYDIALKCAKYLNVPIVTYECDEFFFVKKKKNYFDRFQQFLLNRKIKMLMSKTSLIITISNDLKNLYEPYFRVHAETIMTATSYIDQNKSKNVEHIKELTYMGNIRCNRYVSLLEIGLALDEINTQNNTAYSLKIYTGEKDSYILSELQKAKSIKIMGFVSGKAFEDVFLSAQTLLHVEAFDEESIDTVKNSISTKIADSLGFGNLLVAYGPSNVASMRHLCENGAAFVINKKNDLKQELLHLFTLSEKERYNIVENALSTARKYHTIESNGRKLYRLMNDIN